MGDVFEYGKGLMEHKTSECDTPVFRQIKTQHAPRTYLQSDYSNKSLCLVSLEANVAGGGCLLIMRTFVAFVQNEVIAVCFNDRPSRASKAKRIPMQLTAAYVGNPF